MSPTPCDERRLACRMKNHRRGIKIIHITGYQSRAWIRPHGVTRK
ncbi:hypothetical protein HMPREF0208_01590 [Citrobacter koseri]|nr:hypothetical protein HMPREF3207_00906 [Citrobacter koseri]KXB45025.1 hypothetical protein HMPREF0208_01590 [Citrobacter koseri]